MPRLPARAPAAFARALILQVPLALASLGAVGCATGGVSARAVALSDAGAAALAEGALDGAEARLRLALEYQPELAEAHVNLGLVALARGDLAGAEASLEVALAHDEDSEEAWQNLGVVRLRRGDDVG
ncbi:MAG: tetratricopeptide repeat protein, partial [Myxococcota bacterium]